MGFKGWNNVGGHNQCYWNVECVKVYVAEVVDDVIVVEKGCGLCIVYCIWNLTRMG